MNLNKELGQNSLKEITDEYISQMKDSRFNESKHELYLSILKACPYFILSTFSISSIILINQLISINLSILFMMGLTFVFLLFFAYLSTKKVREYTDKISENNVRINEIKNEIDYRDQMMIDYLEHRYDDFNWDQYELPRYKLIRYFPNALPEFVYDHWIGPLRKQDVELKFPTLTLKIKNMIPKQKLFNESFEAYYKSSYQKLQDTFSQLKIEYPQHQDEVNRILEALLIYLNRNIYKIDDQLYESQIMSDVKHWYELFSTEDRWDDLTQNVDLSQKAEDVLSKMMIVRNEMFEIKSMMNTYFGNSPGQWIL